MTIQEFAARQQPAIERAIYIITIHNRLFRHCRIGRITLKEQA